LVEVLEPVGAGEVQGRTYHLLHLLAIREVIVQGPPHPTRPGEQHFAPYEEWIPDPLHLAPEEAVARWAESYFRSHGPATVQDFARWTGLPLTTARHGLAAVSGELGRAVVDGVEHWMDPTTPDLLADHRRDAEALMLLPGFDELLLGYADRTATLPAQWAETVVPGRNGMFKATVVHRGVVVGTWARGRAGRVEATPFTRFTKVQEAAIGQLSADAGR
ncbi:MAG: winged helix DNA-binding domain-containing protein, partial [Actinobacteria bacterium]|nr:winged helix DNA-binding domain-containing protein [Actinomycetota bacterium]